MDYSSNRRRWVAGSLAAAGLAALTLTSAPALAGAPPASARAAHPGPVPGGDRRLLAPPPAAGSGSAARLQWRTTVPVPVLPSGLTSVPLDPAAPYVAQDSCDNVLKPGVVAFERLIEATYPGTGSLGDIVPCGTDGPVSEHFDGRAWDWAVAAQVPWQKADADALLGWLTANNGEMARRLGLMYIVWNDRIWGLYRPSDGWRNYNGCPTGDVTGCHEDHVHFSFAWAGAQRRTSWWTGKPALVDYGPCRVAWLTYAPPDTGTPNVAACPAVAAAPSATALQQWSGAVLYSGSYGPAVPPVQRALGVSADGSFGPITQATLVAYQKAHGVPATGVTDLATWRALLGLPAPPPASAPVTPPVQRPAPTPTARLVGRACPRCFGRGFLARRSGR